MTLKITLSDAMAARLQQAMLSSKVESIDAFVEEILKDKLVLTGAYRREELAELEDSADAV